MQGVVEEYGEEQDLEDVVVGECVDYGVGDYVYQEVDGVLFFVGSGVGSDFVGVEGVWVDVYVGVWLDYVDYYQVDDQGYGGDDFEVQQCYVIGFVD